MGDLVEMKTMNAPIKVAIGMAITAVLAACTTPAPEVSHDGLQLQGGTQLDQVYIKPGVSLAAYTEVGVEPCTVAFRKNWLRDQNTNRVDLTRRVTQKDVDKIKDNLSEHCDKFFKEALLEAPAYTIADSFDDGEAVLVLRPSIINLDINAPDTMSPGMSQTYTTSAGQATLSLEMADATTGEVLVRVVDKRRDFDTGRLEWTNSVTNRADADRALRYWAGQLRKGLDRARDQ